MKDGKPPFSAVAGSQSTSNGSPSTGAPVRVDDPHLLRCDRHDLVLADLHGSARVVDERGDVGAQEVLALAQSDDQRAS